MSFPPYATYKDTNVDWLGNVPEHWIACAINYRYQIALGKMLDEKQISGEHLAPYLRNVDVQWGRINTTDLPEMDFRNGDLDRYALRSGDLLVCEGGEVGRAAVWNGELAECYYQKALHRLRPRSRSADLPKFAFYLFCAAAALGVFTGGEGRSTIAHLTAEALRRYLFPFPPLAEQSAIVAFLDRETAKIDALVTEQGRLIELLKEKRQAVISHAVTKGLDPNAPMKDSGVEWLGQVPEHWEVKRLKQLSPSLTVGIVVNPSEYVSEEGLPFLYGGDIGEGSIDILGSRRISSADSTRQPKTQLREGDLVTVRVGAPGVTAVVPKECDGGNCASVMLIRRGAFSSHWLCFAMNSRVMRHQVELVQYGAAQEQFNIGHAVDFVVPTPPHAEQDLIASALHEEVRRIDGLISQAEEATGLLMERRSALISAAVTGKIDVCGAVDIPAEAA